MTRTKSCCINILRGMARGLLIVFVILLPLVISGMMLWYQGGAWKYFTIPLWGVFGLVVLWHVWQRFHEKEILVFYAFVIVSMISWWATIEPRADRDWAPEVAHIATGTINDNFVTLHNVRNFRWSTKTDYDVAWEPRTYNMDEIETVDLFLSYWGMPAIAHTLVGFGFKNGDRVVFSVEIRKEKGEEYSDIAGFFKQYELSLISADERDIIYVRTNVKDQDVYHYVINMPDAAKKQLFMSYIEEGNGLASRPQFYNTLTANCTTTVFRMLQAILPGLHMDARVLLSGYLPGYIYKIGGIDREGSLSETIEKAAISAKAKAAGDSPRFSEAIRW
jgi:hypothetical protein